MSKLPVYSKGKLVAFADVDPDIYQIAKQRKWSLHPDGYVYARTSRYDPTLGYPRGENIYLHRLVMAKELLSLWRYDLLPIDHLNGPLDNRRESLQVVTPSRNAQLVHIRNFTLKAEPKEVEA